MNPHIWLLAQKIIGGTYGKQKLALSHYKGGSILEIGCSIGNIAEAFRGKVERYLGQDIDEAAIRAARKRLPDFEFMTSDLAAIDERFDYVMVAGVLHHVDDETAVEMLSHAKRLCRGSIMSFDPLPVPPGSGPVRKLIGAIEQGQWIRTYGELGELYKSAGLDPVEEPVWHLSATLGSWPEITDLAVLTAKA